MYTRREPEGMKGQTISIGAEPAAPHRSPAAQALPQASRDHQIAVGELLLGEFIQAIPFERLTEFSRRRRLGQNCTNGQS